MGGAVHTPGSLPQVNEVWNSSFTKSLLGDCSSERMRCRSKRSCVWVSARAVTRARLSYVCVDAVHMHAYPLKKKARIWGDEDEGAHCKPLAGGPTGVIRYDTGTRGYDTSSSHANRQSIHKVITSSTPHQHPRGCRVHIHLQSPGHQCRGTNLLPQPAHPPRCCPSVGWCAIGDVVATIVHYTPFSTVERRAGKRGGHGQSSHGPIQMEGRSWSSPSAGCPWPIALAAPHSLLTSRILTEPARNQ